MRLYVVYLVAFLLLLFANAGDALATIDPSDNFDDGVIDTSKWLVYSGEGTSVTETGGKLVLTNSPTTLGTEVGAAVLSTYRLRGAFDIQVDYELTQWPANNDVSIAFCASPRPEDENAVLRTSWTGEIEQYSAAFNAWTDPTWISVPTTDTSGKLRLVRDAGNVLFDYYWQADTSQWVLIGSQQVSEADFVVILYIWGNVLAPASVAFDNFQVNSGLMVPPPIITDVQIDRGRDADWWDFSYWHTRYVVQVQGSGDQQPAQLWLQDMQGLRQVINADGSHWYDPAGENPGGSWEDARVIAGPDDSYTFVWYEARQQLPIPAGSYTITVVGTGGSQTSLTTAELPAVPDAAPTLLGPADQSAIETAVPTFQWLPLSGTKGILQVRAEGDTTYTSPGPDQDDCGEIWRASVEGQLAAVYNFDGTGPDLDPGRTYFWQVDDWTPVDDRVSDPRVSVWNSQASRHRFTVDTTWPPLPALPGQLAYEQTMYGDGNAPYNLQAILQYGTTPAQRKWVGPDGSHTPSYSWDGTKIAYRVSDWGAHVANADGSDSVQLPGNWDWYGADLSPDATWITYSDGEWQGSEPQHIFIQKLFEPERTLLVRARSDRAWDAHWSPDGVWISYLSCCDPSGNNVWLIHPDGTGDHPVLPTGVAGYPGATVTGFAGTPAWSPDATRLGVGFYFTTGEGQELSGIGTMPRDGGEITPVWFNPPGVVCCASARFQTWSPDGNSVVFASAHQMPVDPEWANGKFEPGVEVWMISADGSGAPTRLTYDYSNNPSAAWWAPNTPAGSDVSVTKGDATVTFEAVGAEGSTAVYVVPDRPGPLPEGYTPVGDCWALLTNAPHSGDIAVALRYRPAAMPTGTDEAALRLLAWDGSGWRNVTTSADTTNHLVQGDCAALSRFTLAAAEVYLEDIPPDFWAFDAISACAEAGIVQGYEDGTYRPDLEVTRAQMAAYIARALAGGEAHVPTGAMSVTFSDVPADHWALRYVGYCAEQGIVLGYSDGTYHPDEVVNRGQMAVYVARAVATPTGETGVPGVPAGADPTFADVTADSEWSWCYPHVEYCAARGIVQGYEDGTYHPERAVTRDQMAVYIQRAFELPL